MWILILYSNSLSTRHFNFPIIVVKQKYIAVPFLPLFVHSHILRLGMTSCYKHFVNPESVLLLGILKFIYCNALVQIHVKGHTCI